MSNRERVDPPQARPPNSAQEALAWAATKQVEIAERELELRERELAVRELEALRHATATAVAPSAGKPTAAPRLRPKPSVGWHEDLRRIFEAQPEIEPLAAIRALGELEAYDLNGDATAPVLMITASSRQVVFKTVRNQLWKLRATRT